MFLAVHDDIEDALVQVYGDTIPENTHIKTLMQCIETCAAMSPITEIREIWILERVQEITALMNNKIEQIRVAFNKDTFSSEIENRKIEKQVAAMESSVPGPPPA